MEVGEGGVKGGERREAEKSLAVQSAINLIDHN